MVDFVPGQTEENRRTPGIQEGVQPEYDSLSVWTYDGLKILVAPSRRPGKIATKSVKPSWPPRDIKASRALFPLPRMATA